MGHRLQGWEIEGLAIVSTDGMIADAAGEQPESLRLEADQRFFHERLRQAQVFVQGRHSGAVGSDLAAWPRLILTRRATGVDRDPAGGRDVLWNPAGASLEQAVAALGLSGGTLAVIGGTEVFGLFLELGYDRFHLSRAGNARLPDGRPVFPGVQEGTSPEDLMARRGLREGPSRVLDKAAALTLVTWLR